MIAALLFAHDATAGTWTLPVARLELRFAPQRTVAASSAIGRPSA